MKKEYIEPNVKISQLESDGLMDTFSLPTTGEVEDPSVGQSNEQIWYDDWDVGESYEQDESFIRKHPTSYLW